MTSQSVQLMTYEYTVEGGASVQVLRSYKSARFTCRAASTLMITSGDRISETQSKARGA